MEKSKITKIIVVKDDQQQITEQIELTDKKLGSGSFGLVMLGRLKSKDNSYLAVKIIDKNILKTEKHQ